MTEVVGGHFHSEAHILTMDGKFDVPSYRPNEFNFTKEVVDYWGRDDRDPVAMIWKPPTSNDPSEPRTLHYSHFSRRARQIARGLRGIGIQQGDVLLLVSSKTPEWYETVCACILSGVVICLCSSVLTSSELYTRAKKAQASIFVGDAQTVKRFLNFSDKQPESCVRHAIELDSVEEPVDSRVQRYTSLLPDHVQQDVEEDFTTDSTDPCLLYFTSGTTGHPKIVQHTHVSYPFGHITTGKYWLDVRPGSVLWNLSDQGWAKAMWAFFGAWSQGAALFVDAEASAFDPEKTIEVLHRYPITTFCAAPAIYRQLVLSESKQLFAALPPRALEHCTSAGENLESHVMLEWYEMSGGLVIWNGFGQTETSILSGNYPAIAPKVGSMGKPLPGVPLFILNDQRDIAHPYEEGDIAVKVSGLDGHSFQGLFEGYISDDGSVTKPIIQDSNNDSWYLTGDRAHCDEDGYLWYKGRADDLIISAGHRIGPAEVESVLQAHFAVTESAVVGAPHEERGTTVKAFIVLSSNSLMTPVERLKQEIRQHCLQHKPAHYCPQVIEFVEAGFLPKTVSGKIMRRQLRLGKSV